jgi:hypothetical protein
MDAYEWGWKWMNCGCAYECGWVWTNDNGHCSVQWINLNKCIWIHRLLQILWMNKDEYMDGERLICCMIGWNAWMVHLFLDWWFQLTAVVPFWIFQANIYLFFIFSLQPSNHKSPLKFRCNKNEIIIIRPIIANRYLW